MESIKMSFEDGQKAIETALEDARGTGEHLGIVASMAFHDEFERASFLTKARKVFEDGIEMTLNMSDAQMIWYAFGQDVEDFVRLMEALK